jgi:small subunit ribosomal protein S17
MKQLTGTIISTKMMKTAVVRVDRSFRHPMYLKIVKRAKNYLAHNDGGAKVGQKVVIRESRPLSRKKRWRIIELTGLTKITNEPEQSQKSG